MPALLKADPAALAEHAWRASPAAFAAELSGKQWRRGDYLNLISTALVDVAAGDQKRLIINLPPRRGKSELVDRWFPAWLLELFPQYRVILASHESALATLYGRRVRDTLQLHASKLTVRISETASSASEWETAQGGGMLSRGIGGSITGRGANVFIVDDPIKNFEQAHSKQWRDEVWNWWLSTARLRLEPGGAVIVVMTRWHEDDFTGRLLSAEWEGDPSEWTVIRIPALAETPDLLDRPPGTALVRPWETAAQAAEDLEATRRDVGPYVWSGAFQQQPSEPEGAIFRRAWWQYWTELPADPERRLLSFDMSFKDTADASYVVGQAWIRKGADLYLTDQVRGRWDYPETREQVRRFAAAHPEYRLILVEDKANGPAIIADLKREIGGLVAVTPRGSKESRAHAVTGMIEAGNVWLPSRSRAPWVAEFVEECAEFPRGANDDQVDAMTQALNRLADMGGPVRVSSARGRQIPRLVG